MSFHVYLFKYCPSNAFIYFILTQSANANLSLTLLANIDDSSTFASLHSFLSISKTGMQIKTFSPKSVDLI